MPWANRLLERMAGDAPPPAEGERVITHAEAVREALTLAMEEGRNVFTLGQGINDPPGGIFGVTHTLVDRFGPDRVFDTPLSEDALTGICAGAAMQGMRPVYLHNRPDFLLLAFDHLVNHASKTHYLDRGKTSVPMVVWTAIGRGWGGGAQHSQAIQGLLMTVPGLKILMPSTAYDAKGLMLSAITDNNPVLIFEHRWLLKRSAHVPEGFYTVPLGKGVYRRRGRDITIAGTSHAIVLAQEAAAKLAEEGIDAEVIDLRSIKPLDEAILLESVARTGRFLAVDTGWEVSGVCAELGFVVAEKGFAHLKAPVGRVGLPACPHPAGRELESYFYPTAETIADKARSIVRA